MLRSIRVNLLAGYLGALVLLLLAWSVAGMSTAALRADYAYTVRTTDALTNVVLQTTKLRDDEETGLRGYLLTGKRQFLAPYLQAQQQLPLALRQTDLLATAEPDMRGLLQSRLQIADRWERWAQYVLRHAAAYPHGSVALIAQQEYGKSLFDQYRQATAAAIRRLDRDRQANYTAGLQRLAAMNLTFAILFTGAVGLLAFLGWRTTAAVLNPLTALRRAAMAIGRGEWTQSVVVRGADEFTRLAGEMDWMRQQLVAREAELAASEERLRTLYQAMACGVMVVDAQGLVVEANAAALQILGVTRDEFLGQPLAQTIGPSIRDDGTALTAEDRPTALALATGQPVRDVVFGLGRLDGALRWVQAAAVPLVGSDGTVQQVVTSFVDVTERNRMEAQLRASEQRLRAVTESAHDAIVTADRQGCIVSWNAGATAMFGRTADEVVGQPLTMLMPQRFQDAHQAALQRATARGVLALAGQTVELVGLRADGGEFPLDLSVSTWTADDGLYYTGIMRDVTERRQAEEVLRESEWRLRLLLQAAPVGTCIIDERGNFEDVNDAYAAMHGYTPAELIGQSAAMLVAPEDQAGVMADYAARVAARTEGQREMQTVTRDGTRKTLLIGTAQISGIDGRPLRASFVVDITERKQAEQRLEQMAHYDALTRLPNRVLFNDRMEQALRLAAREQRPGALFVMDLDGFKAVNDRLGHEAGDLVLAEVSQRLRRVLRASDTPARLGGDEFAILLPHTDEHGAATVAEKILAALAVPLDLNGQAATIGGSIGIALFPPHGDDAAALMRHADLAMYWAKRAQRGYALYTRGGDGDSLAFDGPHREVA